MTGKTKHSWKEIVIPDVSREHIIELAAEGKLTGVWLKVPIDLTQAEYAIEHCPLIIKTPK